MIMLTAPHLPVARRRLASRIVKIFFDGGCRPNPGAMELAVVALGEAHIRRGLGHGTSFDAEWLALIHALGIAQSLGVTNFVLLGDAVTVVAQANGVMACRGTAVAHREAFLTCATHGMPLRVRYIKRTQNLAGIALARSHA